MNDKYNVSRYDRNKHDDGVMIFINKLCITDLVKIIVQYNNVEFMWSKFKIGINYFLFGLINRPLNSGGDRVFKCHDI